MAQAVHRARIAGCTTNCARASRARSTTNAWRTDQDDAAHQAGRWLDALERAHDGEARGISRTSVQRICQVSGLSRTAPKFKVSTDPFFDEKVSDIVGLYLNPPDKALVLCVDEKSQIQALDRTQPILPMGLG